MPVRTNPLHVETLGAVIVRVERRLATVGATDALAPCTSEELFALTPLMGTVPPVLVDLFGSRVQGARLGVAWLGARVAAYEYALDRSRGVFDLLFPVAFDADGVRLCLHLSRGAVFRKDRVSRRTTVVATGLAELLSDLERGMR